jgi:hypothetical protein
LLFWLNLSDCAASPGAALFSEIDFSSSLISFLLWILTLRNRLSLGFEEKIWPLFVFGREWIWKYWRFLLKLHH